MKPVSEIEPWDVVSKRVYWDRAVELEKWREMISCGHRSYLPAAVAIMDVTEFIHFYSPRRFVQDWPTLRENLTTHQTQAAGTFDVAWSRLAGGGWNLKPSTDFHNLPKRRKQFLLRATSMPGRSIYDLAKDLGLQYRRAYEHAQCLIKEGKLRDREVIEGGRRKRKIYPGAA